MKLRDPGTRLDPTVRRTTFNERQVPVLRVTYAEEVGKDIWYFYVDPETWALTGCRFFHDESKNDGEYIAYEGEIRAPTACDCRSCATGTRTATTSSWRPTTWSASARTRLLPIADPPARNPVPPALRCPAGPSAKKTV